MASKYVGGIGIGIGLFMSLTRLVNVIFADVMIAFVMKSSRIMSLQLPDIGMLRPLDPHPIISDFIFVSERIGS